MAAGKTWGGTGQSATAQALLLYAATRGVDPSALLARFSLDPAQVSDVDGRIPMTTFARMWSELPELTGDPELALSLAEMLAGTERLPLSTHLFLSSATLEEAIRRMVRFQRVLYDGGDDGILDFVVAPQRCEVIVRAERSRVPIPTNAAVFEFAMLRVFADRAAGASVPFSEFTFRHARPDDPERYARFFGAPIVFDAARDSVALPTSALSTPHPNAPATLVNILDRYADVVLDSLPRDTPLAARVCDAVRELLPDGDASLERIAAKLGMPRRTLQRHLESEGKTLRKLIDDVRRATALGHLRRQESSLAEIAFCLGFSDQAAFHRAFVRWTSLTPGAYRNRAARRASSGGAVG